MPQFGPGLWPVRLNSLLWSLDKVKSMRELTALLAFGGRIDIDSARVRER